MYRPLVQASPDHSWLNKVTPFIYEEGIIEGGVFQFLEDLSCQKAAKFKFLTSSTKRAMSQLYFQN